LERLFRDARCGRFHPANTFLVHKIVAKTALGIDLGEQPRAGDDPAPSAPARGIDCSRWQRYGARAYRRRRRP
jgi:hypothetical protein